MSPVKVLYFLAVASLLVWSDARAADIEIIANPGVKSSSLAPEELKGVFLLTKISLKDGSPVEPVLDTDSALHEAFIKDYLGKTDAALQAYYRSLIFTGKASMPKTFRTEAEVVAYVAKTKGAVGYVSTGTDTTGVKVLEVK
jgi:hypothetical protein